MILFGGMAFVSLVAAIVINLWYIQSSAGADSVARFAIFAILAFVLSSAVGGALGVSHQIVKPIERLHTAMKHFGQGMLDERVSIHTHDEIEDLASGFNAMAEKLCASMDRIGREEKLASAEKNKLELILEGISDAIVAVDSSYHVILFNRTAERLTGYSAQEAIGKPIDELLKLYDKKRALLVTEYCPVEQTRAEGVLFAQNGLALVSGKKEERYVNVSAGRIKEESRTRLGCILTFRDITREQLIEKIKSEFVGIAAHQLRTPLTEMKWSFDVLLAGDLGRMSARQKDFLGRTSASNDKIISIIDDLLEGARIEEGRFVKDLKPADFSGVLESVVAGQKEMAKKKGIRFTFTRVRGHVPLVRLDPDAITVAIRNILDNAITYTPSGGSILVAMARGQGTVELKIADTGIGISPEDQHRIFDKFFRAKNALKMDTDGNGFGLFIAKNIIEAHGGTITFTSELGKGTEFVVRLPVEEKTASKRKIEHVVAGLSDS